MYIISSGITYSYHLNIISVRSLFIEIKLTSCDEEFVVRLAQIEQTVQSLL